MGNRATYKGYFFLAFQINYFQGRIEQNICNHNYCDCNVNNCNQERTQVYILGSKILQEQWCPLESGMCFQAQLARLVLDHQGTASPRIWPVAAMVQSLRGHRVSTKMWLGKHCIFKIWGQEVLQCYGTVSAGREGFGHILDVSHAYKHIPASNDTAGTPLLLWWVDKNKVCAR